MLAPRPMPLGSMLPRPMLLRAIAAASAPNSRMALLVIAVCLTMCASQSVKALADETPQFTDSQLEFFESKVRPLLIKRCYECHDAKAGDIEGGLALNLRSSTISGGDTGAAIVPGDPDASLLIRSIGYDDLYEMPPDSKLPDGEIEILTRWVRDGAAWTVDTDSDDGESKSAREKFDIQQRMAEHWAWQPVVRPKLPPVADASWPRDPVDRFALAKLESAGLAPAKPADRRTWIRRIYFDLIGLPPTIKQVDEFLADTTESAHERVVDGLLASPHFGEHWARHWMDLTRYAETCGHEFDYPIQHAWRYRDYLIRAFNADVPYDQFVSEHIAGDLLPEPRRHPTENYNESLIGTGFWFLGEAKHGPVDVRAEEAGYIDNRIDVMSKAFLGLTIACARCHDHKFDAISTQDYYGLAGFLQSSRRQWGALDPHEEIRTAVDRLKSIHREGNDLLARAAAEARGKVADEDTVARYLLAATNRIQNDDQQSADSSLDSAQLQRWIDLLKGEAIRQPEHPLFAWYHAVIKPGKFDPERLAEMQQTARKFDFDADYSDDMNEPVSLADFQSLSKQGAPDGWFVTGNAFQFGNFFTSAGPRWTPHALSPLATVPSAIAHSGIGSPKLQGVLRTPEFEFCSDFIHYRIAGADTEVRVIIDGYDMFTANPVLFGGIGFPVESEDGFHWHTQKGDIARYKGHRAHLELIDHGDGWIAIDQIVLSNKAKPPATDRFAKWLNRLNVDSADTLADGYAMLLKSESTGGRATRNLRNDLTSVLIQHGIAGGQRETETQLQKLATAAESITQGIPKPVYVQAITEGTIENEYVFIRGNHKTPGKIAPRRLLEALDGDRQYGNEKISGRLELAAKIASAENPFTARVVVNRLWHHLTGQGIVASTDNFGVLGQRPTHPELLDFLADEMVADDWSIKRMIRRVVLSNTYRMSSQSENELAGQIDPQNLLLHRMRLRRLSGESIRDSILLISGTLDEKLYGPSVPIHLTEFMKGRGRPKSGPLNGDGRRSVYLEVRRNFLSPMMLAFDTPQPVSASGRRNRSNVPAQALIMMNDPFVIEQAGVWAERLLRQDLDDDSRRIEWLYETALARPPAKIETTAALQFLKRTGQRDNSKAAQTHAWRELCHVLLNLKEFIYLR